jgi:hypothetical protein
MKLNRLVKIGILDIFRRVAHDFEGELVAYSYKSYLPRPEWEPFFTKGTVDHNYHNKGYYYRAEIANGFICKKLFLTLEKQCDDQRRIL